MGYDGLANRCIEILKGLTTDQLRWIYSSYTVEELEADGWDRSSVPNLDGDMETHLWSELDPACESEEILISGVTSDGSGAFEYFSEILFTGRDEGFDVNRTSGFFNSPSTLELVSFLENNTAAISFFQLSALISKEVSAKRDAIEAVPIQNAKGAFISPKGAAFEDSSYPLSRRFYIGLLDDESSLANTKLFLEFALSDEGNDSMREAGFWPISEWERIIMLTRIQAEGGIPMADIQQACGPEGSFNVAGSSTVYPTARVWTRVYTLGCPNVKISLEGGGSGAGAARACAVADRGDPVDIGNMSREWTATEAEQTRGFLYKCIIGVPSRSLVKINVANDGITLATRIGGVAQDCISILGGLTIDQIRWMYTDYTDLQLQETGWDPRSLRNTDNDSRTHKWSELDRRCEAIEIRIAGADDISGTYEFFKEAILKDLRNGEGIDLKRPFPYVNSELDEDLVAYLREYGEAISYFGYSYYFDNQDSLAGVAVANSAGEYIMPSEDTIGDGTYNPLSRPIYMNMLNTKEAIENTRPFIKFGLAYPELVAATGSVPITEAGRATMVQRIDAAPYDVGGGGGVGSGGRISDCKISLVVGILAILSAHIIG